MSEEKQLPGEATQEHHGPVPKFLMLVYAVIATAFVVYLITGLKFGEQSPTGF